MKKTLIQVQRGFMPLAILLMLGAILLAGTFLFTPQSDTLAYSSCGNSVVEEPFESCDDGNNADGDGCSATCQLECGVKITNDGAIATDGSEKVINDGWVDLYDPLVACDADDEFGLKITGDNVVLDCNGFGLDGSAIGGGVGIWIVPNFNPSGSEIKVYACDVKDFGIGVYLGGENAIHFYANRVFENTGDGIRFGTGAANKRLDYNRIFNNGLDISDILGPNNTGDNNTCATYTDWADDGEESGCTYGICGDGYLANNGEECDDGNTTSGDGCSETCEMEAIGCSFTFEVPNATYVLQDDLSNCTNIGLGLDADNITLDCAGHSITAAVDSNEAYIGIEVKRNGITIQDCDISNFQTGIFLPSALGNATIIGNTLTDNPFYGIRIKDGDNVIIDNNTVSGSTDDTFSSSGVGIYVNGDDNFVINNNSSNNRYGFYLANFVNDIQFSNNIALYNTVYDIDSFRYSSVGDDVSTDNTCESWHGWTDWNSDANTFMLDPNNVAIGNGCANPDKDEDLVNDSIDNCIDVYNPEQTDTDYDGEGDACDDDDDGDGVPDTADICPGGDDNIDTDLDGIPDFCDECPLDPNNDIDSDGVCGDIDNCPNTSNSDQINTDGQSDGGDACDTDDDNDGLTDEEEELGPDGIPDTGDETDPLDDDSDDDGVNDGDDDCPLIAPDPDQDVDENGCTDSTGDLADKVEDLENVPDGTKNSLLVKLNMNSNNINQMINNLKAFIRAVSVSNKLNETQKAELIEYAQSVINVLCADEPDANACRP